MRGTVAKRLRKFAQEVTIGAPAKMYTFNRVKTVKHKTDEILPDGKNREISIDSYTVRLTQDCTRKVYKELKAAH